MEEDLKRDNPEWVFFLDWSWKIPPAVYNRYKCVMFHEAPLPFYRGGSPIQHQILAGVKKTKLTAFMVGDGLDTGDILLQEDLDLSGHLLEIFGRTIYLERRMIERIVKGDFKASKQASGGTFYKRRTPKESEIDLNKPLGYIYDFIRMLEDPYPNAFMYVGDKKITFKSAEFGKKLTCVVEIE